MMSRNAMGFSIAVMLLYSLWRLRRYGSACARRDLNPHVKDTGT
jgi:hypothetical protein